MKVAFEEENGGVSILNIAKDPFILEKNSEKAYVKKTLSTDDVIRMNVPTGAKTLILGDDSLPKDFTFRKAWKISKGKVVIDMDVAKDIHMNNLRKLRNDKFIELGVPFKLHKLLEAAVFPPETVSLLQELRDIPQVFDLSAAKTPEELKELIPDILK